MVEDSTKKIPKTTITVKSKTYMQLKSQQANRYTSSMPNKYYYFRRNKQAYKTKFKESVTIKNNWEQVKDVYKTTFEELAMEKPKIEEIKEVGIIRALNPEVEKVQRREYRLSYKDEPIEANQTINDEVFREILGEIDQEDKSVRKVFSNEKFLTALMTLKVSQYPWHIKITKINSILILDTFDPKTLTYLDLFTANENTQNNMPNDEGKILEACLKATHVSNSFKKQIADGDVVYKVAGEEEKEGKDPAYTRYVKIRLHKDLEIYTKANIDAGKIVTDESGDLVLESYLVRALFETETNYEWKKKFQTSAGEVISQ